VCQTDAAGKVKTSNSQTSRTGEPPTIILTDGQRSGRFVDGACGGRTSPKFAFPLSANTRALPTELAIFFTRHRHPVSFTFQLRLGRQREVWTADSCRTKQHKFSSLTKVTPPQWLNSVEPGGNWEAHTSRLSSHTTFIYIHLYSPYYGKPNTYTIKQTVR